jgi:uncharacterized protein (TIGR02996 family)
MFGKRSAATEVLAMTHDQAFLRDIREHPQDDTPRLIYADWLEDHGQSERAEFIRIECTVASGSAVGARRSALQRRANALEMKHRKAWLAPLRAFSNRIDFFRGLPDHMLLLGPTFLKHAEALFRVAPVWYARFRLGGDDRNLVADLAGCPELGELTTIDFESNKLGATRLEILLGSSHLPRLKHLFLNNNALGKRGMEALARSPILGQLRSLDLTGNAIGDAGLRALAESPHIARLECLSLGWNNNIAPAGAQAFLESPHLGNLKALFVHIPLASDFRALKRRHGARFNPNNYARDILAQKW